MNNFRSLPSVLRFTSFISILIIWYLLSILIDHRLFASPFDVFSDIHYHLTQGELIKDTLATLSRALISFFIAMFLGSVIGYLLAKYKQLDYFFDSWVIVGLNIPALVLVIIFYIWLGLTEIALISAVVLNKMPIVIVNIREGARALEKNYFPTIITSLTTACGFFSFFNSNVDNIKDMGIVAGLGTIIAWFATYFFLAPLLLVTFKDSNKTINNSKKFKWSSEKYIKKLIKNRKIILPQLYPYLMTSARTGLSLIWKIVLVFEFLGRGSGIGFQIQVFFQFFDISSLLAYAIFFMTIILIIENFIMIPIEKKATHWRKND